MDYLDLSIWRDFGACKKICLYTVPATKMPCHQCHVNVTLNWARILHHLYMTTQSFQWHGILIKWHGIKDTELQCWGNFHKKTLDTLLWGEGIKIWKIPCMSIWTGVNIFFFLSLTRPPDKILIKIFFVILHPTTDLCFVLPKASRPQYCDTRGRGLVLPPYQLPHAPGGRIIGFPSLRYKPASIFVAGSLV